MLFNNNADYKIDEFELKQNSGLKMYIFIYPLNNPGGVQTLLLRVSEWLINLEYKVVCIAKEVKDEVLLRQFKSLGVDVYNFDITNFAVMKEYLKSGVDPCLDLSIINFTYNSFINIETYKFRYGCSFNNLIYVVHPYTLAIGNNFTFKFFKRIDMKINRSIINKMLNNRNIVFMDEGTVHQTELHYSFEIKKELIKIIRLPMIISNTENTTHELSFANNIILTLARAEFPFKGYILGLIDDFINLKKEYSNLKLVIISAGIHEEAITNKLLTLSKDLRDDIIYRKRVEYNELSGVFDDSKIFVGMGTSILDAANNYTPSIVSNTYTFENVSSGFFHENPFDIGSRDKKQCSYDLIKQVLDMEIYEYNEVCNKSHEMLESHYDIDKNLLELIAIMTLNSNSIQKTKEFLYQYFVIYFRAIWNKIKRFSRKY